MAEITVAQRLDEDRRNKNRQIRNLQSELSLAREQIARLRAMVERHIWNDNNASFEGSDGFCMECDGWREEGHQPDCALAALLKETE